jgi:elongation factor G
MGELHLEILIDRLAREFGVRVKTGPPQVVYRETIGRTVEHRERFHREIDGRVQSGELLLVLTPLPHGSGVRIDLSDLDESPLPHDLRPVIATALENACSAGCRTGYPLTDLSIRVVDAPWQQGVTTELGLRAAAQRGLLEAAASALVILEPVMALEIITPEEYAGKVLGALQQKRGRVARIDTREEEQTITAQVPLAEMFGYMTDLRSATRGRGTFTMEFSRFDTAPEETRRRLLGER